MEGHDRVLPGYFGTRALDGNARTIWLTGKNPPDLVLSFLGHDTALVAGVTITLPPEGNVATWDKPVSGMWPKDVEVWTSDRSPTEGFVKRVAAPIPEAPGDHSVPLPEPVQARYVKFVFNVSSGPQPLTAVGDVAVHEGRAAGYASFLQRHQDLASLLETGKLPAPSGGVAPTPVTFTADAKTRCAPLVRDLHPANKESHGVLIVGDTEAYAPYSYYLDVPESPKIRYFPNSPGSGLVDSSIFRRAWYWPVAPQAASPAALVPTAGIDTVVLSQECQIKTTVSDAFKHALVDWVAAGHKLIIQDSDRCGPYNTPDYSFLPFPFATSNPGSRGAASSLRIVESNFIASPDPADPAFMDEEDWRLKRNGNFTNDFGDSNTVVKYDPNWCGAIVGTNVNGAMGFVLTYAHWGRGIILYDGVDHDQAGDLAYRQYVAREMLMPFDPDGLPCSTRLSPFVVTTDPILVTRTVLPGQTITYPLAIRPIDPAYKGTVKLSLDVPPEVQGLAPKIDPDVVTVSPDAKATLSVTMPQKLPGEWRMAVRGIAPDANATLCLSAAERRTGRVIVRADLGAGPPEQSRKNLLVILDLSGSMNLPLGRSTRIRTAREVLHEVLGRVPDDFQLGLRLYGHRYNSRQKETCTDSELVVPVQPNAKASILRAVDATRPRGETPLVYSVLQAIGDLKRAGGGGVVLITDGEESCGGDFAAAAHAIHDSGLDFRLNIVGFTLTGEKAREQLGSLAAGTGGRYYSAADGPTLSRALVAATIERFPYSVKDSAGNVVAEGEAGDTGQDLPPGQYTVIVKAGDDALTLGGVQIAVAQDSTVRVVRAANGFALQR